MSVIIKGMKKPSACDQCPFFNFEEDEFSGLINVWCDLDTFSFKDIDFKALYSKFPFSNIQDKNCPLIAVPPHGRLIDADKLVNYQMRGAIKYANGVPATGFENLVVLPISSLSEIPTVLEADYEN